MKTCSDGKQSVSLYLFHSGLFFFFLKGDLKGTCTDILKYIGTMKIGKAKVYLYYKYGWHIN